MRILFLSAWFPNPPDNGSKIRILHILSALSRKYDITLLSFYDQPVHKLNIGGLQSLCSDVKVIPWKSFEPHSKRAFLGFLSSVPRSVVDTYSKKMDTQIRDAIASDNYDLVIASQTTMASYFNCFHGFPAIFEEAEVGIYYQNYVQSILTWHRIRNRLTWMKHRHYLSNLLPHFRKCTVVSKPELDLLTKINRNYQAFEIIPNCIDIDLYSGYTKHIKPYSLIFTGSFRYSVNYDAMVWFINEVYPKILSAIPNANLTITGDNANLQLPTYKGVTLTGYLDDIRPVIANSFISIVPIRFGGGTRLKILESMALYTPVVTTSKGAEGLDIQNEHNIMIADTPEVFAEAIICLFNNPEFYKQLTQNAYQLVREKYDCSVVMPYFLDLVEQTVRS